MDKWMDLFSPEAIALLWTEAEKTQVPYLGTGLFPARKQAGLDLSWLKGASGLPISLMPSTFDAQATYRDRIGVEKLGTEMPFFREGYKIKEKDRQELLRVLSSNDPYVQAVISHIYQDIQDLIKGANVVPERMRMQLLFAANGNLAIQIKANGVDYTYNYDPNGTWKAKNYYALSGNNTWDNASTADPFEDVRKARDKIRDDGGEVPQYAIMNSVTFRLLRKSDAIKNRFLTTNGRSVAYLKDSDVKSVFLDTTELSGIMLYDNKYRDENKVVKKFVPDGYVALVPGGAIGSTVYGTTPEEADLMGSGEAKVSIVNTGVAITQTVDPHPVNLNIYASEIVLPSYEGVDNVALLKVTA
ncbi:MAG: major capsid protein [Clostridium sp.]|nr:major capsid protein [Clostridium sp.]